MKEKLIVALDVDNIKAAERLVKLLYPFVKIFKVGSQLFTSCGVEAIKMLTRKDCRVFLDLKFYDIPNTVAKACRAATRHGVFMLTIHAQGGAYMMKEALKAVKEEAKKYSTKRPLVLGVTVLTSEPHWQISERRGSARSIEEEVLYLAKLAKNSHLDGVVASAHEANNLKAKIGNDFLIVTPGVRPKGSPKNDQVRTMTPGEAIRQGSDYIVVGRSIIEAEDPAKVAKDILEEING